MKTKQKFTLVELLIVIAIIAILASMILPALRSALDKARAIQCTSNQKQLSTATHLYVDDNNGYIPSHNTWYSSTAKTVSWATVLWSYVTHKPVVENYGYLQTIDGGTLYEPKLGIFRCPAVLEPFKISEEMKHIGRNNFMGMSTSYPGSLFITKCLWPSERMLYSDYYSPSGYYANVSHYTSGGGYTGGYMTYLHPGLTATVTHLDGHVKAWNMHAVPKTSWDSRFWGANPSCTGKLR